MALSASKPTTTTASNGTKATDRSYYMRVPDHLKSKPSDYRLAAPGTKVRLICYDNVPTGTVMKYNNKTNRYTVGIALGGRSP